MRSKTREHMALVLLLAPILGYSWMYADITVPNERTRTYLSVALVDDGSLSIDGPVRRFGPAIDWSSREGRYYTDKAPGSSFLGAVPYGIVRAFSDPGDWTIEELINLERTWLMLPLALFGFVLMRLLLARLGLNPVAIDIASLAWMLGTNALHYSAAFYGHHIVAVALVAALYAAVRALERGGKGRAWLWASVAGGALGAAVVTEYQAAVPAFIGLIAMTAAFERRRRCALALWVAFVPFVALLMAYHDAAFGGPMELPYDHLVSAKVQALHQKGVGGVSWPTAEAATGALFSLHRGLLVTCPLMALALPGLWAMWKTAGERFEGPLRWMAAPLALSLAFYLWFISSADAGFAGWSFGPRLLVPGMGIATVAVAFAIDRGLAARQWRSLTLAASLGLTWAGVAYNVLMNAVFAEPPQQAQNPLLDVAWPMVEHSLVSVNLLTRLGLTGTTSLLPLWVLAIGVGVYLGIIVVRAEGRGHARRLAVIAGALVPVALLASLIASSGPSWNEMRRNKWVKTAHEWDTAEVKGRLSKKITPATRPTPHR